MSRRKKAPPAFLCTDTGNAKFFASQFKDMVFFDHKQQRWLIWDASTGRWIEDKTEQVRELAKAATQTRVTMALIWPHGTDEERAEQKREIKWAINSQSLKCLDAALELARSVPSIADAGDGWDRDPWLFGVANGIVDLRTGTLRPGMQQDRITKFSPVTFDPNARCPRFERFMLEIFDGDVDRVGYVQRSIGYCLTGSVKEQCLFLWHGHGANGKTTLIRLLHHLLGDYAVNLQFSALEMDTRNAIDMVALEGARLATAAESNEGVRLNEARIKMLTGGDAVTARAHFKMPFTFEPTHKLILAFNHEPRIADDSVGMWRRIRLVPFTRRFEDKEQDKNLLDKLKAEAPGILAWAVTGCLAWQREGLEMPSAVAEATAAYRHDSDHIGQFVEDCCAVAPSAVITIGELWDRYLRWAEDNGEKALDRKSYNARLEQRGFRRTTQGHAKTRIWKGITLGLGCGQADRCGQLSGKVPKEDGSIESFQKSRPQASAVSADEALRRLIDELDGSPKLS